LEEVLTGGCILSEWRPDLVKMVLDELVPENVYVTVVAQKFGEIATEVNLILEILAYSLMLNF